MIYHLKYGILMVDTTCEYVYGEDRTFFFTKRMINSEINNRMTKKL